MVDRSRLFGEQARAGDRGERREDRPLGGTESGAVGGVLRVRSVLFRRRAARVVAHGLGCRGVVVLLYTIETHYMRQEMVRSNAMQVQPVLITRLADPPPGEGQGDRLWAHNIGKGPALHVTFEGVDINFTDITFSTKSAVKFFGVDFIEAGQREVVRPVFGDRLAEGFKERSGVSRPMQLEPGKERDSMPRWTSATSSTRRPGRPTSTGMALWRTMSRTSSVDRSRTARDGKALVSPSVELKQVGISGSFTWRTRCPTPFSSSHHTRLAGGR